MANEVFANGLEIACKAADGVSSAAFPDVCWTPKEPVPFTNTAYAKDTTNGSKTVFISGKEVALKDYSYIKTSSGDDAAKGSKGFITGAKNGQAYFRSWSMNVKVEGYNVCRHTDSMTHNHGSYNGNTGVWKYIDTADRKGDCKKDVDRVEKECKTKKDKKKDENNRTKNKTTPKAALVKLMKEEIFKDDGSWKSEQCKGMLGYATPKSAKKAIVNTKEKVKEYTELANNPQKAIEKAIDNIAYPDFSSLGSTLKFAGGKIIGVAGCLTSSGGTCADIANAGGALYQYSKLDKQKLKSDISKAFTDVKDKVQKTVDDLEKIQNLSRKEYSELMKKNAALNKCLNARKCMLVPYKKNEQTGLGNMGQKKNSGCCAGQTPHHIIPKSWNNCENDKAPNVCTEGTNQYDGSHGNMHTSLNQELQAHAKAQGGENIVDYTSKGEKLIKVQDMPISKEDVVKLGADSHEKVYPKCSKKCITIQLKHFYDECNKDMKASTIGKGFPQDNSNDSGMD